MEPFQPLPAAGFGGANANDTMPAPRQGAGRANAPGGTATLAARLSDGQKAAVIVRLLLMHQVPIPLERLASSQQERLARHMTEIRRIDPATLEAIVEEFTTSLDGLALTFPRDIPDALEMLEPYLSANALAELEEAKRTSRGGGWERILELDHEELMRLTELETPQVCAILLSKLPADKAAAMLADWPPERAETIAHAVATTGVVTPRTVNRVGLALAAQLDAQPSPAFRVNAADRVGLILNAAKARLRDSLLEGLAARDEGFADEVRKTIFTFEHIPSRLPKEHVGTVLRAVPDETLALALAAAVKVSQIAIDYLLDNVPKRMAESLREEAAALGEPDEEEGEDAMNSVIARIRELEAAGEIKLEAPAPAE